MGKKIALGQAVGGGKAGIVVKAYTTEEKIQLLESQLKAMTYAFYQMRKVAADANKDREPEANAYDPGIPIDAAVNRDGIPVGTKLIGITSHAPYVLIVGNDGKYYVNNIQYQSLSAAASGIGAPLRKSGWRFWKLFDGRPVKEVYRKA